MTPQSVKDALADAWPICQLHGQAEGACLPCHEHQLVRDCMPRWSWRLHSALLLSISLGCDSLAAAQTSKLAHVAHAAFRAVPALREDSK